MAASDEDKALEYEQKILQNQRKPIIYLPEFAEKLQEKSKRVYIPPPPITDPVRSQSDLEYKILDEIRRIHEIIRKHGEQGDFGMQMKFGQLLSLYGADQIDRLSEVLANARKNGYVNYNLKGFFEPERDDDVYIRSIKTPF